MDLVRQEKVAQLNIPKFIISVVVYKKLLKLNMFEQDYVQHPFLSFANFVKILMHKVRRKFVEISWPSRFEQLWLKNQMMRNYRLRFCVVWETLYDDICSQENSNQQRIYRMKSF